MKKRKKMIISGVILVVFLGIGWWYLFMGSHITDGSSEQTEPKEIEISTQPEESTLGSVTEGTEEYRGFVTTMCSIPVSEGDIHYNVYIPESYDGSEPYGFVGLGINGGDTVTITVEGRQ